jgi:hypothetical protein
MARCSKELLVSMFWMVFMVTAFVYESPSPAMRPDILAGLLVGSYLGLWHCLSMHSSVVRPQQVPTWQAVAEGGLVVFGLVVVFPLMRHLLSPAARAFFLALSVAFVLVSLGYHTFQQFRHRPAR